MCKRVFCKGLTPVPRYSQNLITLGAAFGRDPAWAAWLVGFLGLPLGQNGSYDADSLGSRLELRLGMLAPDGAAPAAVAEMGPTPETVRLWLKAQFEQHGLALVGRALRHAARMTLRRQRDGSELRVMTYTIMSIKRSGQATATINYLDDEGLDWIAVAVKPWGKAYLRRKGEIIARLRPRRGGKTPTTAAITFSPKSDADLFEHRIAELVEGK